MIIYDPIIKTLQSYGGITVYYNTLINGCIKNNVPFIINERRQRKIFRYSAVPIEKNNNTPSNIFHSSYYRLPKEKSLAVVTTVHDFIYEKYISGAARIIHSYQKKKAIINSNIIICISQNTANDLMNFCSVPESKIRIVYNGVSDGFYTLPKSASIKNKVLFIGSRASYKNFELAIKAVSLHPELELNIVGGGDLNTNEINLLKSFIPDRFHFKGSVNEADLNVLYNESFCLLYPSSYEGFGIPILEAMRAGCPVIAVNSSSIPEVAGDAALLSNSLDIDEISILIDKLYDENIRKRIIELGLKQSLNFSWDKCFNETKAIYDELSKKN